MNYKLIILIFFIISIYGCNAERKESENINEHINYATTVYRESGLLGVIDLINNCPINNKKNLYKCLVYDYTGYFIDKGMAEINRFPLDDFFKDDMMEGRFIKIIENNDNKNSLNLESSKSIRRAVFTHMNGGTK